MSLHGLEIDRNEAAFDLKTLIKSNRTGDPLFTVQHTSFPDDKCLCVVSVIRAYISKTKEIRRSGQLLVSFIKPHKAISRDTLARWTIGILKQTSITNKYASYSTHGTMVSKARQLGISVKRLLAHVGWKTARSFTQHYNKRIEKSGGLAKRLLTHQ